ncbi:MAG: CdaR family protein [Chloroflexota bacterium]|nr:CdaR family protein [Chloroflexota bacterium]
MNDLWVRLRPLLLTARTLARATVLSLVHNWPLTLFSLVLSFAIWFLVEDVENPRIEATVPAEEQTAIPVEVVNVPSGLIVGEVEPIRVFVEAREEDIDELRAADFNAVVDASQVGAGDVRSLPVTVTTERREVRVIRPEPRTVEVSVVATVSRELPVTVVITGELPSGFRQGLEAVDPPFVEITGREELVDSVDEIQATVSIAGLQNTQTFNVELVPRTSDGSRVTVTLSRNRARVTVPVEEALLTRQIAVLGGATGAPARGYTVTDVAVSPSPIEVTGPRDIVESLSAFVVEDADVSGAIAEVIESRELDLPPGVSANVDTVFITVTIDPQIGSRVLRVVPVFSDTPQGLELAAGVYFVEVRLAGLEPDLARLGLDDVTASVSLAGAPPRFSRHQPEVSVPEGIEVVSVAPLWVQLVAPPEDEPEEEEAATDEEGESDETAEEDEAGQ